MPDEKFQWDRRFASYLLGFILQRNVAINVGLDQFSIDYLTMIEHQEEAVRLIDFTRTANKFLLKSKLDEILKDIETLKESITNLSSEDDGDYFALALLEISGKQIELDELIDEFAKV